VLGEGLGEGLDDGLGLGLGLGLGDGLGDGLEDGLGLGIVSFRQTYACDTADDPARSSYVDVTQLGQYPSFEHPAKPIPV